MNSYQKTPALSVLWDSFRSHNRSQDCASCFHACFHMPFGLKRRRNTGCESHSFTKVIANHLSQTPAGVNGHCPIVIPSVTLMELWQFTPGKDLPPCSYCIMLTFILHLPLQSRLVLILSSISVMWVFIKPTAGMIFPFATVWLYAANVLYNLILSLVMTSFSNKLV